ncbi:hypothetical protein K7X08_008583 [Anisodus acutangulus]|uniref:Uncharacterized protein n=1 Tax=Anisodus acutangulus TaxID=402998 RepID=A0A9Q1MQL2_9SOLA|nr:hypothetical protein K7X08_008583 [Anisodus acutangulus]
MVKDQVFYANNMNAGDENIVVSEKLVCLEDQNLLPTSGSQEGFCANNNICEDDHQFEQEEEEFESAKASVAPVEETLYALYNLLNGYEDFHSLLSTLLQTKSDISDPIMCQIPHLISTWDQFSEEGCDQMQLRNYETALAEYCFPMDPNEPLIDDQFTKQGGESSVSTLAGEGNQNDIVSYRKALCSPTKMPSAISS